MPKSRRGSAWKARAGFDYARENWFSMVRETFGEHAEKLPRELFPTAVKRFADAEILNRIADVLWMSHYMRPFFLERNPVIKVTVESK